MIKNKLFACIMQRPAVKKSLNYLYFVNILFAQVMFPWRRYWQPQWTCAHFYGVLLQFWEVLFRLFRRSFNERRFETNFLSFKAFSVLLLQPQLHVIQTPLLIFLVFFLLSHGINSKHIHTHNICLSHISKYNLPYIDIKT